jgi:hypothetical protein
MPVFYKSPAFFAITTVIAIPLAWFLYDWINKRIKFFKPKSEFLFTAGVSTQMIPRFNPYLKHADTLFIVGGDGAYFTKSKGKAWCDWLMKTASKGIKIKYIFVEMSDQCELLLQHKCRHENIEIYTLKNDQPTFYEKYLTYHPTLLESDDKQSRLIWLEHNHPQNSSNAYSINFVTTENADFEENFIPLKADIELLLTNCDPLVYKDAFLFNKAA